MSPKRIKPSLGIPDEPLWYKDAIIYELHVRSFFDSDGDGIGDFKGVTQKLDYLQELGVTALWILPFCPSPLKDDGYDIADYTSVNPDYGTLKDFKKFLTEAHSRGFKVISELVLNHTSDQHPWFQRARRAKPGAPERDFYVWSQDPNKYREARIIFPDFEASNWTWDPVAQAYYWHRFFSHQPDLNFENPLVQKTMLGVVDFWFGQGVDGLRLDAIPYLFEAEGTDCVGLPETHEFLKKLRAHVDGKFKNRMFLAEANMWPEDAISFFGDGDECHMSFHFPLMPRLFMAMKMEDRYPIVEILEQTPTIPESCQWANFLRNHDELTLEMVTDEERDYMYRSFVQDPQAKINAGIRRRLAPLLRNNRRQIELLNGLLFSLVGTPVIYYGDEIGMGDNIYLGDRNGVRTPMQWNSDRNAGFSKGNPQRLVYPVTIDPEYHYEAVNVEAQHNNPHSLLWWMRRLISLRKRYRAFARGDLKFLQPDNHKVLAFVRRWENQTLLVMANLSRFVQGTRVSLKEFAGYELIELFGQNHFPPIGREPYFFTLAPHSFYWFSLELPKEEALFAKVLEPRAEIPVLEVSGPPENILSPAYKMKLEELLPEYLKEQHWFGGKYYKIRMVKILGEMPLFQKGYKGFIMLIQVSFVGEENQAYLMGMHLGTGEKLEKVRVKNPQHLLAEIKAPDQNWEGGLYNAVSDPDFCKILLDYIIHKKKLKSPLGDIVAYPTRALPKLKRESNHDPLEPRALEGDQTNTVVIFGQTYVLKIFRQLEWGTNPDLEMSRFLLEKKFNKTPPLAGVVEFHQGKQEPVTLCLLYGYVENQGEAWEHALDALVQFYEAALTTEKGQKEIPVLKGSVFKNFEKEPTELARNLLGNFLVEAQKIGELTGQLHRALSQDREDPRFCPEPFDPHYQRSLFEASRGITARTLKFLRKELDQLPEDGRYYAKKVLKIETKIQERLKSLLKENIVATRIRCHGDYHLRQLLFTGKDYVVIDFEGEPGHHWSIRKLKRSPFRDVASMIRSFHYATYAALYSDRVKDLWSPENDMILRTWARYWYQWVSASFLKSYLKETAGDDFLPQDKKQMETLLSVALLEKSIYEVAYELEHRPDWVKIPLRGILQLMEKI